MFLRHHAKGVDTFCSLGGIIPTTPIKSNPQE
jgi:hypothetical protein